MPSDSKPREFLPVAERVSIFLRGKTWYANYQHDGRQVRRSLGTGNKKEGILRAQRIEADLDRGDAAGPVQVATIGDVINAFLQATELDNRAPKTLGKYRLVTSRVRTLADTRRRTHIAHLDHQFADAFRAGLKQAELSPKTIYNAMVIVRSLTLFAHRRRMCDIDPLAGYKLHKPKPTPQPCWSPQEADAILADSPMTYRPYFTFLRETGCRAGEGKYLTWSDVDLDRHEIFIRPKDGWKPKTGDQRKVPITARLAELLGSIPRLGRWVFTAPTTIRLPQPDRQIQERRALLALKRVLSRLKLDGHLHTFRHTFISQALMAGVPEAVVRSWVGHVDPEILRLYTHVSDDVSRGYVDRFSANNSPKASDGGTRGQS